MDVMDKETNKLYYEKAAEVNSLMYKSKYNLAQIAMLYKEIDLAEKYFSGKINKKLPNARIRAPTII